MTLTPEDWRKTLEIGYAEVCRSHAGIIDYRSKLLALLPLASGAGLFLLLETREPNAPLAAIGVFGCAVTLGLFVYELRNIEECHHLLDQGGDLEDALGVPSRMRRFQGKPKSRFTGLVGSEGAGWIVYAAIFCGWLHVAVSKGADGGTSSKGTDGRTSETSISEWLESSARWWLPAFLRVRALAQVLCVAASKGPSGS